MSSAAGVRPSPKGSTGNRRLQPRTLARAAQLALVVIVVAAALITAPSDRVSPANSQGGLLDQDRRTAAFADAAADGLAALQAQPAAPFGSGYLGTDRGELFTSDGTNYGQSISALLIERELVDAGEAAELARNGVRFIAHQCAGRVGVLATSSAEVSAEANAWWTDNDCEPDFVTLLAWPVYVAMGDDPGRP